MNTTAIAAQCVTRKSQLWLENIRENFDLIKDGLDVLEAPCAEHVLVIGAGPSLERHKHLELLADRGFDGTVIATDRIVIPCLDAGIEPDYVVFLDAHEKIFAFVNDPRCQKLASIMCASTHPRVVYSMGPRRYWFVNSIPNEIAANMNYILTSLTKKSALATAGHCGSAGWSAAYRLGAKEIYLIGIDLSGMNEPVIDQDYVTCSTGQIAGAAARGCRIVNCTEGGALIGDTIEQRRLQDVLG